MRRRKVKGADEKLLSYDKQVIKNPVDFKGGWSKKFNNHNPIYIEVGTGRGKFLTTLAKQNPNINFIAMEIKEEVLIKAVQKADEAELNNILFIWGNVQNILDYFEDKEIDRIFINFCDPWPKKRWAKRRLTHSGFLDMYNKVLSDDGEIHFKTDNEKLFEFSINEISEYGLKLQNISLDLANSEFEGNVTTEYEDKFMNQGMKIYRCEGKKR
ncbi:tRNA (guanosine(46)-N7)-methyltransferase TrmB [Tepidibacter mesophilus]|uniref:tRNA (guanosine(46)-N7)-methyltransferase TrmB n=1 Tax=Tepidibacter mesophilus TaxID=655607 RepID=UPI000C073D45|nr:tRNA (guanosine(46)-N7)-methyltransferase TrmB [Tepidibacter mesophilus]